MKKKTYVYFISLLILCLAGPIYAQDTVDMPLKIRIGFELSGPAMFMFDQNTLSTEAYVMADLNEKRSVMLGTGILKYKYSQYNYDYNANGFFIRTGMDFNLLEAPKSQGIYWAGIGLHYGLTRYSSEVPSFTTENYWGKVTSSIDRRAAWGHFVEVAPGVRAEVFKNVSIGWTVSLRLMIYSGTGKDLRPLYLPGFGNGANKTAAAMSYFITWNIPYKRIRVITKPPAPEEEEEPAENIGIRNATSPGGFNR
jgi:hypothetical protein